MIRSVNGGRPLLPDEAIGPAHARAPSPRADGFFDAPSLFTSVAWYIARVGPRDRSSEPTSVEQADARNDSSFGTPLLGAVRRAETSGLRRSHRVNSKHEQRLARDSLWEPRLFADGVHAMAADGPRGRRGLFRTEDSPNPGGDLLQMSRRRKDQWQAAGRFA